MEQSAHRHAQRAGPLLKLESLKKLNPTEMLIPGAYGLHLKETSKRIAATPVLLIAAFRVSYHRNDISKVNPARATSEDAR